MKNFKFPKFPWYTIGGLSTLLVIGLTIGFLVKSTITSTTQWDIRTTGSDTNGGAFDTSANGQDFSQQDAAQVDYTDLVIGGTTTQATSAAHPFTACSAGTGPCGNIVNVVSGSGCTVQRKQVVSVSGSTATFDGSLGTAASTCTAHLGGSLANLNTALTAISVSNAGGGAQAYNIHVKAGTYTYTSTVTLTGLPSNAGWTVTGYGTTHNDGGTKPLFTTATNSTVLFIVGSGQTPITFSNISFSNTASTRAIGFNSNNGNSANPDLYFVDCVFDGFSLALDADNSSASHYQLNSLNLIRTEVKNGTVGGMTLCILVSSGSGINVVGSWIHDNTGVGLQFVNDNTGATVRLDHSIFSGNTGKGVSFSSTGIGWTYANHVDFSGNGGDGLFYNSIQKPRGIQFANTIFWNNGGWGINAAADTATVIQSPVFQNYNNAFGSNTSGNRNNITTGLNDLALAGTPFTSTTNFLLNAVAGAALKGAGSPALFPGGSSTSAEDIGAVQSAGSSAVQTVSAYAN